MILSCVIMFTLIFYLCKEADLREKQLFSDKSKGKGWHLHEAFTLSVALFLIISMGSSSMVEEEQYIWHFMTSTLYFLFFRDIIQSFPAGTLQCSVSGIEGLNQKCYLRACSVFMLLVFGRILRGWHQGGVNWTNLPDISKWLEQAGNDYIKLIHLGAGLLLSSLSLFALSLMKAKRIFILMVQLAYSIPGLLVLQHIVKCQDSTSTVSSYQATLLAQKIYVVLGVMTIGTAIALPWFMPVWISETCSSCNNHLSTIDSQNKSLLVGLRRSVYLIGWAYVYFWCLLQMLLQQRINSMPILLLLLQILASLLYSSNSGTHHKQWVEVSL